MSTFRLEIQADSLLLNTHTAWSQFLKDEMLHILVLRTSNPQLQ